jgi:hypothetical protein
LQSTSVLEGRGQRVGFPTTLEEPFVLCHSTFHVGGRSADNRPDCRLLAEYGITMAELMEQQLNCFIKILHLMMVGAKPDVDRSARKSSVASCSPISIRMTTRPNRETGNGNRKADRGQPHEPNFDATSTSTMGSKLGRPSDPCTRAHSVGSGNRICRRLVRTSERQG